MSTSVKWYTNETLGAPVLSGTAGALLALLDATLVTGFGLQAVTSLVVVDGVATMTVPTTPSAVRDSVVLVSGVTPSGLNGEQRVTGTTSNTIKFATTVSNQTATGTISVKMAPAGWEKVFSGTNLAVYRSPNVQGTRQYLRVDDTGTITALMRAYEGMSDTNTGTDKWMDNYWFKSTAADSTPVGWQIYADDRTFYLRTETGNQDAVYPFGDFNPVRANDPFSCIGPNGYAVNAINSGSNNPPYVTVNAFFLGQTISPSLVLPRSANFLSKTVTACKTPEIRQDTHPSGGEYSISSGARGSSGYWLLPYPNTSDNALVFTKFHVLEISSRNLRGSLRGVFSSPQWITAFFPATVNALDGQGAFAGRKMGVIKCNGGTSAAGDTAFGSCTAAHYPSGRLIVDLTGPW